MIYRLRDRGRGRRRKQSRRRQIASRPDRVLQVRQNTLKRDWGVYCPGTANPMLSQDSRQAALKAAKEKLKEKGGEIQILNYAGEVVERAWVFR